MALRPVALHGEHGVEQEYALGSPAAQVAVVGYGQAQVGLQLLVNVDQRRRHPHPLGHGEAQAHSLAGVVVRVLPKDHYFDLLKGRRIERIEDEAPRRVDHLALLFFPAQKLRDGLEIRLIKFRFQHGFPTWLYLYLAHTAKVAYPAKNGLRKKLNHVSPG